MSAIHNFGAGDVIDIARSDGERLLLPFTHETVPADRYAGGRIVVAVPEEDEDDERHAKSRAVSLESESVLTLFPEMFPGPLGISLVGKALANNLWSLEVRDIREHGLGKHRTVDDTPAGGGPGMVMRADVAAAAIDAARRRPERPADLSFARAAPRSPRPGSGRWPAGRARFCSAAGSRAWTSGRSRPGGWRKSRWAISCWPGARSPPWP